MRGTGWTKGAVMGAAMALSAPPALADTFDDGMAALNRSDFATARDKFQAICNSKDSTGCTNLGMMYYNGDGIAKNWDYARMLFHKGCNGDTLANGTISMSVRACWYLGVMAEAGEGGAADGAIARQAYARGCEADQKDLPTYQACLGYAKALRSGLGGEVNVIKAANMLADLCETKRQGEACLVVGRMILNREHGGEIDYALTTLIFKNGCNLGNKQACAERQKLIDAGLAINP